MNKKEREQAKIFEQIQEGLITQIEAAAKLRITERWVRKKLKRYYEARNQGLIFITFLSLITMSAFGAAAGQQHVAADVKSRSEGKPVGKNVNDVNTYLPSLQLVDTTKVINPTLNERIDTIADSLSKAEAFKKKFSDLKNQNLRIGASTVTFETEPINHIFHEAERLAKLYELRISDILGYLTALNEYSTDAQTALRKLKQENQQLKAELAKTKQAAKPVSAAASAVAAPVKSAGQNEQDDQDDQPGARPDPDQPGAPR